MPRQVTRSIQADQLREVVIHPGTRVVAVTAHVCLHTRINAATPVDVHSLPLASGRSYAQPRHGDHRCSTPARRSKDNESSYAEALPVPVQSGVRVRGQEGREPVRGVPSSDTGPPTAHDWQHAKQELDQESRTIERLRPSSLPATHRILPHPSAIQPEMGTQRYNVSNHAASMPIYHIAEIACVIPAHLLSCTHCLAEARCVRAGTTRREDADGRAAPPPRLRCRNTAARSAA